MTKRRKTQRTALIVSSGAAVLLALTVAYLAFLGGTVPGNVPVIGGAFRLVAADGNIVTDRDLRGRYLLIYFGYTSCPDVCPTTLNAVANAMTDLGKLAERIRPVFITVDPSHDTPQIVGDYVRKFSPDIIGLSGSAAEIGTVEKEYRVHVTRNGDAINHSAVLYLIGPDGRYVAPLRASETGAELAAKLSKYLTGSASLSNSTAG